MDAPPALGKAAIGVINTSIDDLFDKLKARVLGGAYQPKQIKFQVKPPFSLPGLFRAAGQAEGHRPDTDLLAPILEIVSGYLDAQRERAKAKTVAAVQSVLNDAANGGIDTDFETVLGGQLADVFRDARNHVKRIIETETNHTKNTSLLDGIIKMNALNAIEDPVVGWLCVHDDDLCDECKRLHLLSDEKTPRLWKMSECGHGYHKKGDESPKLTNLHPHDRCTIFTVLPGYGFDAAGRLTFVAPGWNELEQQRREEKPQPEISAEAP